MGALALRPVASACIRRNLWEGASAPIIHWVVASRLKKFHPWTRRRALPHTSAGAVLRGVSLLIPYLGQRRSTVLIAG
ncbi:hypothetical protein apy_05570 [Aeropyrum pernix]|uniref:Uncharacterized protein n=1 Tax=Aeropyrum pernix TaxID=56636 RepID=A0A401H915_AERPX|nr:hypothetical protein apy_05570 [Aeropyrum pernix]